MTDQITFDVRIIRWSLDYNSSNEDYKLETPILLQDLNGPCPLIALVNTLLLKYELNQRSHEEYYEEVDLITQSKNSALVELKILLAGHEAATGNIKLSTLLSQLGEMILVFQRDKPMTVEVDTLLSQLPLLHTGLSVNPNLVNGNFDESQISSHLFKLFDLKFKHGWCINQIDNEDVEWNFSSNSNGNASTHESCGHSGNANGSHSNLNGDENTDNYSKLIELFNELQSFDKIQDYLLINDKSTNINQIQLLKNQKLIKKWLTLNSSQLTKIGLKRLNLDLHDEEFIVFFRNNHFNTLYKKNNEELYLLITDKLVNDSSNKIIWQSLNSISGSDDLFFNGDFLPVFDLDFGEFGTQDYLLTKQLQEEEDQKMALQIEESQRKQTLSKRSGRTLLRRDRNKSTSDLKPKKRLNCTIV